MSYSQTSKDKKQLEAIKSVLSHGYKNNLFVFIKGGWNIDLKNNTQTRTHDDIDFHFDFKDTEHWRKWFRKNGYSEELVDSGYTIFRKDDIKIDFGAVKKEGNILEWGHGGKSKLKEVVEERVYEQIPYIAMRLNVEEYLKKKHKNLREKDKQDLEIISLTGKS